MAEQQSLDITRTSAATFVPPSARQSMEVAKLVDVSRCIGCKACQAACMEWNDLREPVGAFDGTYTNPRDLDDQTWCVMRFNETDIDGQFRWLILKSGCMHCSDPGCLRACPAPGAIVQYSNGIVDFHEEQCTGCGYCISGCPFDIPRLRRQDSKAYKCTLCVDRVSAGLEPACVKTCPTQALTFGAKADMVALAEGRLDDLHDRGFARAAVYDPPGVKGTHVVFVLPHGDRPEAYGLPKEPTVSPIVVLWRSAFARGLGVFTMFAVLSAGILHYMRHGPLEVPDEEPEQKPDEKEIL